MGYLRYQLVGVRRSFAEDYICGDEGHESGYGLASDRRKVFIDWCLWIFDKGKGIA
ncbi:MAG: hypothetical protein ABIN18_16790 [Pseudomonadota bacterium]